jgi:hypothetical protein
MTLSQPLLRRGYCVARERAFGRTAIFLTSTPPPWLRRCHVLPNMVNFAVFEEEFIIAHVLPHSDLADLIRRQLPKRFLRIGHPYQYTDIIDWA